MNSKISKAYGHYKSLYSPQLLLFRVQDNYEAYFDDAIKISSKLEIGQYTELTSNSDIFAISLEGSSIFDVVKILYDKGFECRLIQSRNWLGTFDIPDVEIIQHEQKLDY